MIDKIRIATRKSPLALWQAEFVAAEIKKHHPDIQVELIPMSTRGDKILDVALAKVGGKGLFVKELEVAMQNDEADIAVHSMKDVPMELPEGFDLPVICERETPFDAFVSNRYAHIDELPKGAVVGTSSLRRQAQLLARRPDLEIKVLRGNVGTRLGKLDAGEYDGILLAAAGLVRLGLVERIAHVIDYNWLLPACGQGAVGIETRANDAAVSEVLKPLYHHETAVRVIAERAMNRSLDGGCQVPIAGFAVINGNQLSLEGRVASNDGQTLLQVSEQITLEETEVQQRVQAESLGCFVAEQLIARGAEKLLAELS
ncbi:hydroxymethylbilane synthase [Reinekea marinisedimentorum]|uniref:Porphobilinogen deaminase n=1 Tax=Reinekea marinisedimentorum TaxID=230495 RepID=A0A4R3I0Y3_9GAMM|nr:hydroxymethylbilane synthase [Reinekea marinisedimentorum]TCS38235.1 hydroxymethylbilane synthase [Reinekea marinisedimentorum]